MSADTVTTTSAFARAARTIINSAGAQLAGRERRRQGGEHRTGAPVLRDSLEAGTFEETVFYGKLAPGEQGHMLRLVRAAREHGRKLRREVRKDPGRRLSVHERALAALTDTAVDVFVALCGLAQRTGKIFPSYDGIADMIHRGRGNVARAIALLERAGFLVRQRRFKRVPGECGVPRYEQTSNVYRPLSPKRLVALLPAWLRPAPIPVDQQDREIARQEQVTAMLDGLSRRDLVRATMSGPLADALARFGAAGDEADLRVPIPYVTAG